MARQKTILIDPVAVDADGLAAAQAVAAAGNLSLNGALISGGIYTGDYARQISITSTGADNGRTFTVTGTGPDGEAQTEAITGPNATTVESTKYWETVTQIAVDDACAGNISSGTVDELVTQTIPLDKYSSDPATISAEAITGTINFTANETFTDFQAGNAIQWFDTTIISADTTATAGDITNHATGVRLKINSYTTGAQLNFVVNQNRTW